ncbi:MAG: MBL fold metallo-hydrolase, partial [Campylobacterota bacterium]|nr:MBL fold metallo-hydrolase [Campylobacterota bacterium]
MPRSQHDFKDAIEIASHIYWIGMYLENDPFQCHPYFIENGNESILIDPGSMLEFKETVRKVKSIANIKSIKYIVLHHQDPDLVAAVPEIEKLIDRDDLLIVTHSRMSLLIKHYLVTSDYYEIDKKNNRLITSNGYRLDFLTTPYCHSPGAFVSYEPNTKTLFSGDIFGGIEESWEFYADETYFDKAKQFHEEYMPSKDIFNYALNKIEKLDINLIAPQHGSIIKKQYISNLIKDMKNLDCGLYIENKYNRELLDTINELQEKEKTIQEQDRQLFEQSKRAEMGEM